MVIKKVQLPNLDFSSYQLLYKALKYYLYSSTEFITDDGLTMGLIETIDYIEELHKEVYGKIQLPKVPCHKFDIFIDALKYYMISSAGFQVNVTLSDRVCKLIDLMEKEYEEVNLSID